MSRLIDEKGRLFGKINIIDFIVLVFLFFLLPMLYFGYKIFLNSNLGNNKASFAAYVPSLYYQSNIDCLITGVSFSTTKLISAGDVELNENGEVIGRIAKVGGAIPFSEGIAFPSGYRIILENENLRNIPATLRLDVYLRDNQVYYKDKHILITSGSTIEFKSEKYTMNCKVPYKQ